MIYIIKNYYYYEMECKYVCYKNYLYCKYIGNINIMC